MILAGCSNPKRAIVGAWKLDPASLQDLTKTMPNHAGTDQIVSGLSQIVYRFGEDNKVTMSVMGSSQSATYSVDGQKVTITGFTTFGSQKTEMIGNLSSDGKTLTFGTASSPMKLVRAD